VSLSQPRWLSEVMQSYTQDPHAPIMLAKLAVDGSSVPEFSLINVLLKYKNKIWVGVDHQLHLKILTDFHSSAVGGHFGISVTYHRVKQLFVWKGLKSIVHEFVQSCLICQ
jgi:hypothetical protein